MAALHEDARALLDAMASSGMPPFESLTPGQARDMAKQFVASMAFPPSPVATVATVATVEDILFPGGGKGRLYTPAGDASKAALLYLHGGGWVTGDLDSHDDLCRKFCHGIGCTVLAVDYRLAPEHRFPAAVDDGFEAMHWLHDQAPALGIDRSRILVGGDSAGGCLAAVIAIAARQGLVPAVAHQMLLYPVTDLSTEHPSYASVRPALPLTASTMRWFKNAYLAQATDAEDWRASPLRAASLHGVAPAFVLTVQHDPLCDEGLAYVARLIRSDVAVTHVHFSQHMHGLVSMGGLLRDAGAAVDMAISAVSAFLRSPITPAAG